MQQLAAEPAIAPRTPTAVWRGRVVRFVVLGLLLGLGWETYRVLLGGNLHTVLPGKVYRSAQPTGAMIRDLHAQTGLKSVLNLRAACPGKAFYEDEVRACNDLGIVLHDFEFSAVRLPSAFELRRFVRTLESTPQPLLLHCKQGADRTGLAAVIAQVLIDDVPYAQAMGQLSMRYSHIKFGPTRQMSAFFDLYDEWLVLEGKKHSRDHLRHWLLEVYAGAGHTYVIEEVRPMQAEAKVGQPIGFQVRFRNTSDRVWHFKPHRSAGIHGVWAIGNWRKHAQFGRAGYMEKDVAPGEKVEVTYVLPPFAASGTYTVYLDLVEEGHAHFAQVAAVPHEQELVVRD